jgi:translocation and assembly module TamA
VSARQLSFAVCLLCLASASASAEGLRYRVEGVDGALRDNIRAFLGDSTQDAASAQRFLVTAEERTRLAMEALGTYSADIEVSVDRQSDPWRVVLRVVPDEPVRYVAFDVRIDGPGGADPELLAVSTALAPVVGDVVHHGVYESLKQGLLRAARERGYFDANFAVSRIEVNASAGEARGELALDTGARFRFGPVSGPQELITPELLASIQPFIEGDFYSQKKILELRARLLRLGFFDSVIVAPDFSRREEAVVPVDVDLRAAPRHSYEVGVGFSTDTRERVSLVWSSPRLNRWGHSQQTRLRYSPVNPLARIVYTVPLDDPSNDLLQLGARFEDNEFGDLESNQREFLLRRETRNGGHVRSYSVRALRESWRALEEEFDASYALAGVSFSRRSRVGNAVDPTAGLSQFYAVEAASDALGSDQDLLRLSANITFLRRFEERSRVVTRLSAGYLYSSSTRPDELPPSLAFFAGGDNSIRGYAYQSIGREIGGQTFGGRSTALVVGGTRLLTASLEYQRYLFEDWRAAVFVDAGDAFVGEQFDLKVGVGFGVHYLSPIGALRVELANPVTESGGDWRLHINIGAEL